MKKLNSVTIDRGGRYKWEMLALLWIAFFVNQADRQVFNVVLPLIKTDLKLSDVQIGLVATIFNLVYAVLVPLGGYIGDLFSQKWIVVSSILFWSVATMFTGLTSGLLMLIIMRSMATGAGEAFFGPANYALLAKYHRKTRAFAMSVHQTSYYIGIIVSGYVAGYIGEHWGWRNAFYIFGMIGVIHGVVMIFRLKDKQDEAPNTGAKVKFIEGVNVLFRTPTALVLTLSFSGLIFVLTGYLTWMPTYLYENFHMSLSTAGFQSMFYTHLFAFFGVILAGKWSDIIARNNPGGRLLLQGGGLLVAAPFIILMGYSTQLLFLYIGFAGFGFARSFFDANTYSVLFDVIPAKYHSTVSGLMIMTGFLIGSAAPLILGYLKPLVGLSQGIALLSIVWIICGLLMIVTYKMFFKKDYAKANGRMLANG